MNNRKRQLVHRDIQLTLVKRLVLQWVLFLVATCIVTVVVQYLIDPLQAFEVMATRIKATIGAMLLVGICLAPLFIRDSIRLSLRFVGPIVRLRGAIQAVEPNAENPRVSLRNSDYWQDLAADFNDMLTRIEARAPEREASEAETVQNAVG